MQTALTRALSAPPLSSGADSVWRRLSEMAKAAAERLVYARPDVSGDWCRYPFP